MPDRLWYVVAYGPMHSTGSWCAPVLALSEGEALELATPHVPEGFELERIREYPLPPTRLSLDFTILNSPLTIGEWWKSQQTETKAAASGQASLF